VGLADRIVFLGFVANPAPLFRAADVFVLASHSEPFGLVVAEAREAGCAIVGSNVGGVPEVLEQGRAGLLTPPNDPVALAAAIDRLFADPGLRESLGRRARENLEWLSCTRMATETLDVYRECIEPARERAPSRAARPPQLARRR
jgi:glycosyltransferase involved in cell wall biosynthesis